MARDKKSVIVNSAREIFQVRGLGGSTMEEFARAAGMGKSSLYYYFKSQEEILDAVVDTEIGEIIQESIRHMNRQKDTLSKLIAFADVKFEMTRKRKALYGASENGMDAETASRNQVVKKLIHKRYLEKESMLLKQLLLDAMASEDIQELDGKSSDDTVFAFLAALRGLNREITLHWPEDDAISRIAVFCRIFYKGLK